MQVTTEQTSPCTLVLDITVEEDQVARTFDSVYREFSRYVNVPGFRPGKAPRALLERYVNKERVRERAQEKLIRDTFLKALQEEGITPFRDPAIEPADLEDRKPYTYKATVPLEPQVNLGEYTGLTAEKPVYAITEEMVESRLERMREERARLERITDRGVENGDVLIAEQEIVLEGEEPAGQPRRQLIQIGNNIPGYDAAVAGMMPGEERSFELVYPDDYDEEDKRGKKATYTIRLNSISARRKPELNDEFAQSVGAESLEALRNTLRETMQRETARFAEELVEQRLILDIVNRSEILYPEVLLRDEVEDELRRLGARLRQNGMTYDQFLEQNGQTREEHQGRLGQQADVRIRSMLVLRQIAEQEGLQASEEEVDAEFDRLLANGTMTEEQEAEYRTDSRRRYQVANALVQQRLHDFLFANNTIQEVEQTTPPDAEALAEVEADEE